MAELNLNARSRLDSPDQGSRAIAVVAAAAAAAGDTTEVPLAAVPASDNNNTAFFSDPAFVPVWARSHVKYAQNLLEITNEPIEYDDDEDYRDNCFFFPEDCVYHPPRDYLSHSDTDADSESDISHIDEMIPTLPPIKMLDTSALNDLLDDNLSSPEITSILMFASNGAIFAHASSLPQRQLRNLCATYGAAYTSYAVNAPNGNLTGVNPASHPSSFVTTPSVPLGRDVGSIVFELEDQNQVAMVTKIADKVLLAVVGPTHLKAPNNDKNQTQKHQQSSSIPSHNNPVTRSSAASDTERTIKAGVDASYSTAFENPVSDSSTSGKLASSAPNPASLAGKGIPTTASANSGNGIISASSSQHRTDQETDEELRAQWEIDRRHDLERLAGLNLASSPSILLALESKSAALGRFLSNKLSDLESPEDF